MIFRTAAPAGNQLIWSGGIFASLWQTGNLKSFSAPTPGNIWNDSTLPVDFFNVVIHAYRQVIASFGPAGFQDLASVRSLHARSEAVDAQAATNLRLISAFWHSSSYLDQYFIARQPHLEIGPKESSQKHFSVVLARRTAFAKARGGYTVHPPHAILGVTQGLSGTTVSETRLYLNLFFFQRK